MPIREFKCPRGHITERILFGTDDVVTANVECKVCGHDARRVEISQTQPPILVGEGFYKPSIGGSLVGKSDPTKVAKEYGDTGRLDNVKKKLSQHLK